MKICIFNTLYYPDSYGGAEESVRLLAEVLVAKGHDVYLITLGDKSSEAVYNGVHVFRVKIKNIYWPYSKIYKRPLISVVAWNMLDLYNVFYKNELAALLSSISPDILHTNNLKGFSVVVWDVAKKLNIPIVHTSRDFYLLHPNSILTAAKHNNFISMLLGLGINLRACFIKKKSKKVDHFVGISGFIKRFYLEKGFFKSEYASLVYNPVDSINIDIKCHSENNDIMFGFLGRVISEKGFEVLARALSLTKTKKVMVGGYISNSYKQRLLEEYSSVEFVFLGFVEKEHFFFSIDCLIVPSLWEEPFGRVVIEAFSFGVPVIASNAGGLPELINNETGWVFEKGDYEELAKIINNVNRESVDAMREACKAKSKEFSCSIIGKKYEMIYLSLV